MQARSIDTEPHPIFDLYSAGNFAEVAPPRLSPMSWSLIGDPVERANRRLAQRLWPSATWHTGSHYAFVGYFACRPYHNLAGLGHMLDQVPGSSAGTLVESYFQDAPVPDRRPGLAVSPTARAAAVPRLTAEVLSLRPWLIELEAKVALLEEQVASALRSMDGVALGAALSEATGVLDEAWAVHYSTTGTLVPLQAASRRAGRRLVDHWDELEPWLSEPDELPWPTLRDAAASGSELAAGEFLDSPFYEVADEVEPWRGIAARVSARRDDDGGRAVGGTDFGRIAWRMAPGARFALLPQLTRLIGNVMGLREWSKSLAMRTMHALRLLIPQVARRVGLGDEDWPYVTIAELREVHDRGDVGALVELRRRECREALEVEMPDHYRPGAAGPPAPAAATANGRRRGRGVSPGVVRGVVVTPPVAAVDGGGPRILVCDSADAEVQPDLVHVDGLITARGSLLSHIAIIAREFRIPAVVGHPLARRLKPGQIVSLDGSTGAIDVVDD